MKKRGRSKTRKSHMDDEWLPSDEEFTRFKPIAEADPALLAAHNSGTLKKRGRPALAHRKENISIRLDPAIIDALRAQGRGWQTQLNAFLYKAYVEDRQHPPR